MTILDYSRCEICRDMKKALTPTLTKVVPDVTVDNVLSCNCCRNCEFLRKREFAPNIDVSRIENQIVYFNINRRGIYNPSNNLKTNLAQFELIIDRSECFNKKV